MRIPRCLLLAFASSPTLAISQDDLFIDHSVSNMAEGKHSEIPDLSGKYAAPDPQCDTWVGIEKIFMAKRNQVSPDDVTVTETLTRSICATATTSLPCYPCIMSTPPSSDTALTVTVTSCAAATEETLTVTIQFCSTCAPSVYTGTVPGYTPGGPCHGCTPYVTVSSSPSPSPSPSPCTETDSAGGVAETTTTTTSTSTSIVSGSDCDDATDTDTNTSTPPGNPGLPASTASTTAPGTGTGTATGTGTTATTHTSSKPATAAPPVVTAGGARKGVVDAAGLAMGLAVVGVVRLGM